MATTTPNYGWTVPTSTDLVKDGATAIETLGDSVDATVKALNPETTLGDIAYRSSTANTNTRLGIGTLGQVLTVNGSGVPAWATSAAGGMTQLATGTLSGSAVNLTSISGSYKHLQLVIRNYDPVTDAASILLRINNNTGTTYFKELSLFNDNQSFGTSAIELPAQDNGTSTSLIIANFNDYANTTTWKSGNYFAVNNNETTPTNAKWQNAYFGHNQTAAITQLNIVSSGGNFSGGTYILYGVS